MRSICIILTDPLRSFIKKGEVKKDYYNPTGFFDKVYYVSFADDDVNSAEARTFSGSAETELYPLGRMTALNLFSTCVRLIILVKRLQPSVIRAYDPSLRGLMAAAVGAFLGIPVVISIHAEMDNQRAYDSRVSLRIRMLLEVCSIKLANAVICVTDYVRAYALRYGARKALTIYNGVDVERFCCPDRTDLFTTDTVLCVGRLDKQKYQECLIRAIAPLRASLVCVGDGTEYESLRRLGEELIGADRVRFIRSVPHGEIQDYYASARVFAIATHYEGFCIPVIEAMASGVPIVASRIPPIEEIVGDAGLLAENSPEDFRSKIELLLRDDAMRHTLVEKGKQRARMFDVRINEEKQREVYESVLANGSSGVRGK